jgi:hypothetical protein
MSTSDGSLFQQCSAVAGDSDPSRILQCVSDALETNQNDRAADLNNWFLIIAGALVFFSTYTK